MVSFGFRKQFLFGNIIFIWWYRVYFFVCFGFGDFGDFGFERLRLLSLVVLGWVFDVLYFILEIA